MSRPIGIDLGTTYSVVAYVDEYGKPRVLSNEDGAYSVPSVVLLDEDEIIVGEIAKDLALTEPDRVVACVKRFIGDQNLRRIRITFHYNENTVVEVSATDIQSGQVLSRSTQPLCDLSSLQEQEGEARPRHRQAVLLIDTSYSMQGQEMREAKTACCTFIDETNFEHVEVGLVQFGNNSRASQWHEMSQQAGALKAAIAQLEVGGSTPMAEAIDCGMGMLKDTSDEVDRYLILFTDGCPDDRTDTLAEARRAKQNGIEIICIGVSGADTSLLDTLATHSKGSFFASGGEQLEKTFGDIAHVISGKRI